MREKAHQKRQGEFQVNQQQRSSSFDQNLHKNSVNLCRKIGRKWRFFSFLVMIFCVDEFAFLLYILYVFGVESSCSEVKEVSVRVQPTLASLDSIGDTRCNVINICNNKGLLLYKTHLAF